MDVIYADSADVVKRVQKWRNMKSQGQNLNFFL